jgi:site-specific DNA-cytosine methylase
MHKHALAQELPTTVAAGAGAQLHYRLPQDIRLVGHDHLHALGPVDLVVAGWPCQGNSAAGEGKGLDDQRAGAL